MAIKALKHLFAKRYLQAVKAVIHNEAFKRIYLPNRLGTQQTCHDSSSTEVRATCSMVWQKWRFCDPHIIL